MCDKAVNRCCFVFNSIPNEHKTPGIRYSVVSEDLFFSFIRGVTSDGARGHARPPNFNSRTKKGLTVSVSNTRDIAF